MPVGLEVVQERRDQRGVEIVDVEPGRRLPGVLLGEGQEQPERVAVRGDGAWAGLALGHEPVGEERLQGRGEAAHDVTACRWASSRPVAWPSSSGVAVRYQYVYRGSR